MIAEKHIPEGRRLRPIFFLCGVLLLILATTLSYRQLYQSSEYRELERKQAHRRILRPGPRGDVLDREGRLLIGNRAHYSAVIKLELLRQEIKLEKIKLVRKARQLKEQFSEQSPLTFDKAMSIAHKPSFGLPTRRPIRIIGRTRGDERVKVLWQGNRLTVNQKQSGEWSTIISSINPNIRPTITITGSTGTLTVNFAGLCTVDLKGNNQTSYSCNPDESISSNGISLDWEARYAVVKRYLNQINQLCRRKKRAV